MWKWPLRVLGFLMVGAFFAGQPSDLDKMMRLLGLGNLANAQQKVSPAAALSAECIKSILIDMGYEDVSISGCWVQFARQIIAKDSNAGTNRYTRYIDLDALKDFSKSEIDARPNENYDLYIYEFKFDYEYHEVELPLLAFNVWRQKLYPTEHYDHFPPENFENIPILERGLQHYIPNLDQLTRQVWHTKFGNVTILQIIVLS